MRRARGGFALFVVLGMMAALAALSATFALMVRQSFDRSSDARRLDTVEYLARAGLHQAAAALSAAPSEYHGEENTPLGDGQFTVRVTPGPSNNVYRVESTGALVDGRYTLRTYTLSADVTLLAGGRVRVDNVTRLRAAGPRLGTAEP
jgi:hypothetical protein